MNLRSWRSNESLWQMLHVLFLGQLVSLVLALAKFASSLVASHGVDTPLTLAFSNYLAVALVYGSILLYRRQKLVVPWYWYLLLCFVDVQGNYLVNKAFQYTSLTSVTLLDCFTIAWVIVLTWFFLGTRYSLWQFFCAAICVLGLGLVFLSDAGVDGGGGLKPLLGDTLVILGTLFYAMSNVGEEFCVKEKDLVELLAMVGLFGTVVSASLLGAVMEKNRLESVEWSAEIISTFVGYTLSGFTFCTLAPYILKMSGSTMFNLSLLTSDMWAVIIRIFFYRQKVDLLYYASFAIVVVGLVIYSKPKKDHVPTVALEDRNLNIHYEVLGEESRESGNATIST